MRSARKIWGGSTSACAVTASELALAWSEPFRRSAPDANSSTLTSPMMTHRGMRVAPRHSVFRAVAPLRQTFERGATRVLSVLSIAEASVPYDSVDDDCLRE